MAEPPQIRTIALFYGHVSSNTGDIAINRGQVALLRTAFPGVAIRAVLLDCASSPRLAAAETSFGPPGSVVFAHFRSDDARAPHYALDPPAFLRDCGAGDADLVVLAAGEHLFQYVDKQNLRNLFWRGLPAFAARAAGRRCLLMPSTFGPFEAPEGLVLVRELLATGLRAAARDARSHALLAEVAPEARPALALDPAFFLSPEPPAREARPGRTVAGLALRSEGWGLRLPEQAARAATATFEANGYRTSRAGRFGIAFAERTLAQEATDLRLFVQIAADRPVAEAVAAHFAGTPAAARIEIVAPPTIEAYLAELAAVDCLVAGRFHALVMALVGGRPVFGVHFGVHAHKIPGLFDLLGHPDACAYLSDGDPADAAAAAFARMAEPLSTDIAGRLAALRQATLDWMRADWPAPAAGISIESVQALGALATRLGDEASDRAVASARKQVSALEKQNRALGREIEKLRSVVGERDRLAGELEHQIRGAREELEAQAKERARADAQKIRSLEEQNRALGREIEKLRSVVGERDRLAGELEHQIRGLEERARMLEDSISFRLGHALVLGAKSPRRLAGLPASAWRLWREAYRPLPPDSKRRPREAGAAAIREKLRYDPAHRLSVLEAVPPPGPLALEPIAGRVVYLLNNSLPWWPNGYAMRAHGLARGMQAAGLGVVCLNRPGFPLDIKRGLAAVALPLGESVDGIDYRRIAAPLRSNADLAGYMLAAADALEAELRRLRPEWVVAASNHVTALPALIAARRLGLPFLYEVRGFWEVTRQSREPGFERSEDFRIQGLLDAEVARRADRVFTLTGPMRDELIRRGVDPRTITLLPNSCDPERFTPRPRDADLAARLGIPASVPVIGYIGAFVQYEGLEDLVAAGAMLQSRGRDFRLMLIGNENASGTKGPVTAEIERIAAAAGLSDRLIMPGRVPHDEVAAYYSLIDIAPFPRKPQPVTELVSPMKPLEALAMEKAVVVSSVAALTEMIADEKTGLVFAKGDIGSLADVLDRLIGDPGLRARLGRNGRDWVVRQRTWAEMGRRVRATLDTLAPATIASV